MVGNIGMMVLGLLAGGSGSARDSTPRDTLVLAHEFTAPNEWARVTLEAGQVYRVELTDAQQLQVRALRSGEQQPLVVRTEAYERASRTIVFALEPSVTTVYEVRVGGLTRGAAPIRVYWDWHNTERRQKVIRKS